MPTIRDFMSRVVPWPVLDGPGFINVHWLRPSLHKPGEMSWTGKPVRTLIDFLNAVEWGLKQNTIKDIYFCLSQQSQTKITKGGYVAPKKLQQNALALKAIWLDVDVKEPPKGYATLQEALDAVVAFVTKFNIPPPTALVGSGGGLHVYWISERALSPDEWKPYAEGLKAAAIQFGLRCDAGVTGDSARVLRVPDTLNYKTEPPKPTRVLGLRATDYDFATALPMLAAIAPTLPVAASPVSSSLFDLSKFPKKALATPVESLGDGIEPESKLLQWGPLVTKSGCPFITQALVTGGAAYSQPEWNLTTLLATFLEDGNALAHKMGSKHPGYSIDSTEALWTRKVREREDRGLGWPSCSAIQAAGCASCAGCPHFGKIKSPLNLTKPVAPKLAAVTATVNTASQIDLPFGYALNNDGFICKVIEVEVSKDQPPVTEYLQLFECKVSSPWAQKGPDALNFVATVDKGNFRHVSISQTDFTVGGLEMWKSLGSQGVKPVTRNKRFMEEFLMALMTKLHNAQAARVSMPFGWFQEAGVPTGFIYGGTIFMNDNTEKPAGLTDPKMREIYSPTGELQPWFDACKIITDQKRPELDTVIAASFAGPLMMLTAKPGGLLSVWGESGANKSSATKVGQAVWSHPKKSRETQTSTARSVINKAGGIRHLPIFWDEVKDEASQKQAFTVLFAEGMEGSRLNSNIQLQARGEWQTLMVCCANVSFLDYVVKEQPTHGAGLYRCLEYNIVKPMPGSTGQIDDHQADKVFQLLESNYGLLGLQYAKFLALNAAAVDKLVTDMSDSIHKDLKTRTEERVWRAMCAALLAGATLANQFGANLDVPGIRAHLITVFGEMRQRMADEGVEGNPAIKAESMLTSWLRHAVANTLYTRGVHIGGPGKPTAIEVISGPQLTNPKPIYVQWAIQDRLLRLAKRPFGEWLKEQKVTQTPVFNGLKKYFGAVQVYKCLGAGTSYRVNQEALLDIPVPPGSALEALMNSHSAQPSGELPKFDSVSPPVSEMAQRAVAQAQSDLALVREKTA